MRSGYSVALHALLKRGCMYVWQRLSLNFIVESVMSVFDPRYNDHHNPSGIARRLYRIFINGGKMVHDVQVKSATVEMNGKVMPEFRSMHRRKLENASTNGMINATDDIRKVCPAPTNKHTLLYDPINYNYSPHNEISVASGNVTIIRGHNLGLVTFATTSSVRVFGIRNNGIVKVSNSHDVFFGGMINAGFATFHYSPSQTLKNIQLVDIINQPHGVIVLDHGYYTIKGIQNQGKVILKPQAAVYGSVLCNKNGTFDVHRQATGKLTVPYDDCKGKWTGNGFIHAPVVTTNYNRICLNPANFKPFKEVVEVDDDGNIRTSASCSEAISYAEGTYFNPGIQWDSPTCTSIGSDSALMQLRTLASTCCAGGQSLCPPTATPTTDSTSYFREQLSFTGLTVEKVESRRDDIVKVLANDIFGVHISDIKIVEIKASVSQTSDSRRRRRLQMSGSQVTVVYEIKANSDTRKDSIKSKVSNAAVFTAKAAKPLSAALGVSSSAFTIVLPASRSNTEVQYGSLIINEVVQDRLVTFKVSSDFLNYILTDHSSNVMPSCPPGTTVDRSKQNNQFERSCLICGNGTFSAQPNSLACTTYVVCEPGQYVAFGGSRRRNRYCRTCEGLTWSTTRNAKKCKSQPNDCKPGYYVVSNQRVGINGGNTGPPLCQQCPDSTFSTTVNAMQCTPRRDCHAEGMIIAEVGTSVRDNKCINCGPGECAHAVSHCPAGNFIKMQKSENSSVLSPACVPCPYGFFQDTSNATFCKKWSTCSLEEYLAQEGTRFTDRICTFCVNLKQGYLQGNGDPSKCEQFEPLSVGPGFPFDFVGIIALALVCCCYGGKANKRPKFIKPPEMLAAEEAEAKRKKEEEARQAKKKKRKQNERFVERFQKYYQARKQALAKRRDALRLERIPSPPSVAPKGFAGVVPAVSFALANSQNGSKVKSGNGAKKRVVSL